MTRVCTTKSRSQGTRKSDVHDKHNFRSAHHHPVPTAHYLHSMKTSEPKGSAGSGSRLPGCSGKQNCPGDDQYNSNNKHIHRLFSLITLLATRAWLQPELQERRLFTVGGGRSVNQVHDWKRSPSDQPALED
ncbi:hypothetical protein F511_27280 [Dorcoceras hygrometricum]|uniref:Uncharacterized protein n=1 Tax=Dorcoceras hygrometricum TaxID=472368 RepID=A0A2Z7CA71_9LAMI|nr:hypothetical protein F511_27280 [Dorcoceras hygrometricum]